MVDEAGRAIGVVVTASEVVSLFESSDRLHRRLNWAAKLDYARPFLAPNPLPPSATSRRQAIDRARAAVCSVKASY